MLLDPIEWAPDGWPRALGGDLGHALPKPAGRTLAASGQPLSGFSPGMFGTKLQFYIPRGAYLDRARQAAFRSLVYRAL